MIDFTDVSKTFHNDTANNVHALRHVNLHVDDGDIFGVIGFSGAGKSTLIRLVNALEMPTEGSVEVNRENLSTLSSVRLREVRKGIGMIFQQFNLLNSKTVYSNVAIPLILNHTPKEKIKERVDQLLEFVELSDKRDTYPTKLSGGQKQRVGIARALATNPSILLCDEATSALDPKTTDSILQLLEKANRELGITILIITHEIGVIQKICNRVAVMDDGGVVEQGSVLSVFSSPKQAITKSFVSTVISDSIPESIAQSIRKDTRNNRVIQLKFFGSNVQDSLISSINKCFDIETTILFASVNELQHQVLGILILQLVGSNAEIEKTEDYIKEAKVEFQEVNV